MARRTGPRSAVLATLAVGWMFGATTAADALDRSGPAEVVQADDVDEPLREAGSAAAFALVLPTDASCPGDSANDDYRIQTFVIPDDHEPGALRYEATKPIGDRRWALYDVSTRQVTEALTEMNDGDGLPGRIGSLPAFSFGVFPPDELPPGRYRIGVACTFSRITERFWDARIEVRADAADEPGGFGWRVLGDEQAASGAGPTRTPAVLLVGLTAAGGSALLIQRSRRRHAGSPSKEHR